MYATLGILAFFYLMKQNNFKYISSLDAKKFIADNIIKTILDVRSISEWNQGHYPTAKHIPFDNLTRDNTLNLTEPILVYCRSGRRATIAAKKLLEFGKKNIYVLEEQYGSLF